MKASATWTAAELMKAGDGWRVIRQNGKLENPLVGYCCFPFPSPNEGLLCTTGQSYLSQGTAMPLKFRIRDIAGSAERGEVVRDLVWEADMCFTKTDSFGLQTCGKTGISQTMKSLTEHLSFEVPNRRGFVNITGTVQDLVRKSGVQEGFVLCNAMHITASVFINDEEEGLKHDYDVWLEKLAPHAPTSQYQHNRTGEDNADAHLKRQIMGREVVVAITKGKLDFGPWEQIFYGEFDGRRRKRVLVKIMGE